MGFGDAEGGLLMALIFAVIWGLCSVPGEFGESMKGLFFGPKDEDGDEEP